MSAIEPAAPREAVVAEATGAASPRCKNCDAVLRGRFCANCSQAANVHVPTTMRTGARVARRNNALGFTAVAHADDSVVQAGKLTEEFVAGRRVAYLPPFRLYLIVSIVFFLIASFMHNVAVRKFDEAIKPGGRPAGASKPPENRITNCKDFNFIAFQTTQLEPRIQHICEAVSATTARTGCSRPSARCQKRCSSFCR